MKVACYGTLRLNQPNWSYLLRDSEYLGTFNTEPVFHMYSIGFFPGIDKGGDTSVVCDVFEVDEQTQKALYRLEGYSGNPNTSFYYPEKINTTFGEAEIFICTNDYKNHAKIDSGDWVEFIKTKTKK